MEEDPRSYQYSRMSSQPAAMEGSTSFASASLGNNEDAFRNSTAMRGRDSEGSAAGDVFVRGSLLDRNIEAVELSAAGKKVERARDYKGRRRVWPGILLLLLMLAGAAYLITDFAQDQSERANERQEQYSLRQSESLDISGGSKDSSGSDTTVGEDIVSDDGVVGNPKSYPKSACELPDYQSKDGHIVAISANGTEVPLKIKGINWFGMETGQAAPFGLWANSENGTSVYHIAKFLAKNNFNAVRLPLMAAWILENKVPNQALINKQENRAINTKNYMSLLKGVIKALQFRNIGVLISMHTLTYDDNGPLWYNEEVTEDDFLDAITKLTDNLCSYEYWNIMGVDLKNEPYKGTWGDETATDFAAGATRIANRMLEGCPSWMGFVEGVNGQRTVDIDGTEFDYYDWYGGGLQGAKTLQVEFSIANKVVWAPHYYTPAVYPQMYLYGGGTVGAGGAISGYIELDDDELKHRIEVTMDDMFGFLSSTTGAALLLGEFGGLYAKDAHPMKTTQRCTDLTLQIIKQDGWAGGFVWSLNPESAYQFNPADTADTFTEGVLNDDWLSSNDAFLNGMAAMDDMTNLQKFPCFPYDAPSTSASESESASGSA